MQNRHFSSYNPEDNGDVERVDHLTTQVCAMAANERQEDVDAQRVDTQRVDAQLPHVAIVYNRSVSAATGY